MTPNNLSEPENNSEPHDENERLRLQVMARCREVPRGRVTSYGALGKQCDPPISGYICGRIMGNVMDDVPWWRVIGKDGKLPIAKRGPYHSQQQRELLEQEGIEFDDEGKVQARFFVTDAPPASDELSLFE